MVHQIHECCRCVGEPKGHHHEFIRTITSLQHCLLYVLLSNSHLVVYRSQINHVELRRTLQLIEEIIIPVEWVTILHCQLIQLPIVYAHAIRHVLLSQKHDWCFLGQTDRSNKLLTQQLLKPRREILHLWWCVAIQCRSNRGHTKD